MTTGKMKFTNGGHSYHGKRNSRGKRAISKIHKGLPSSGNIGVIFAEIEEERKQKELIEQQW